MRANNRSIAEVEQNIDTTVLAQRDLETKIYRMSGDNMMKMGEKDELMMLLPEIVLALRREPNELKARVQDLSDQEIRKLMRSTLIEVFGPKLSKLP